MDVSKKAIAISSFVEWLYLRLNNGKKYHFNIKDFNILT